MKYSCIICSKIFNELELVNHVEIKHPYEINNLIDHCLGFEVYKHICEGCNKEIYLMRKVKNVYCSPKCYYINSKRIELKCL